MKQYLYEMHLHTSESSLCGKVSGAEHARFYKALGYDGICITDHFLNGNAVRHSEIPWTEQIDRFESGYLAAKAEGERIGLKVFFGWENSISSGMHLLTYGLGADFLRAHPEVLHASCADYCSLVHENGGVIIQAHPYRLASYVSLIQLDPRNTDAIETDNAGNDGRANRLAASYAEEYGFPVSCGSDNHTDRLLRYAAIASPVPFESIGELTEAILSHRVTLTSVYPPSES